MKIRLIVNAIYITGSVETGARVAMACARRGAKFQLEMGGKNPLVVLDDANLDAAVAAAVDGAFYQTGQRCTASSRLIVQKGIHDAFVDKMVAAMKTLKVDHALKEGTVIGPVVDEGQMAQDEKYIQIARDEGGELAWGGERLNRDTKGHYLSPALSWERRTACGSTAKRSSAPSFLSKIRLVLITVLTTASLIVNSVRSEEAQERPRRIEGNFSFEYLSPHATYANWITGNVAFYSKQSSDFTYFVQGSFYNRNEGNDLVAAVGAYKDWASFLYTYSSVTAGTHSTYLPKIRADHDF